MYYELKFRNIREVTSINLSLVSLKKEEKCRPKCLHHFEYFPERLKKPSFPEERLLYSTVAGAHIPLVKGVIRRNSPITVLCPTLAKGIICSRGTGPAMSGKPYRPKLLVKNHSNPDLQLWSCEGCPNFLIRVKI